jgi:hypothetical protein
MDATRTKRHAHHMSHNPAPARDEAAVKRDAPASAADPLVRVTDEGVSAMWQPDRVDAAGLGSFPASDPPAWWCGS